MKTKILFILLIFYSFCEGSLAQNSQERILESKASVFFSFLRAENFENAAELFHFPEYYPKQELDNDRKSVCKVLELVTDELGHINKFKKVVSWSANYHVGVAGGSTAYWKKHPYQARINYKVEFKKDGPGYIFLYFNKSQSTWKISRADYALPVSNTASKKRTLTIIGEINELIQ